ncbi:hypothetical protein N8768_04350 [Flavobacteriaceae bacterium]|nr:hypothetical protein [Flavobacteriaceae bacterium]
MTAVFALYMTQTNIQHTLRVPRRLRPLDNTSFKLFYQQHLKLSGN